MSFQQTYEAELHHIRETAKAYAQRYPNVAPFLENHSSDQDIERLIEAFAFLTARVQQRLDDGIPEIEQNITRMVWPNALKPFLSHAIVEFYPGGKFKSSSHDIPQNFSIACRKAEQIFGFETLYDVTVYPLCLKKAQSELVKDREQVTLNFDFGLEQNLGNYTELRLPIYLADSYPNALMLNYLLQTELVSVQVTDRKGKALPVEASVSSIPFVKRLEEYQTQPEVFELVEYYFNFPEIFNYIDLNLEIKNQTQLGECSSFNVIFEFELKGADYLPITEKNLRLYTSPVRNKDSISVSAFKVDGSRQQYPLRIESKQSDQQAIYEINSVMSSASTESGNMRFYGTHEFHLNARDQKRVYQEHVDNDPVTMRPVHALSFSQGTAACSASSMSVMASGFSMNAHEVLGLGDIKSFEVDENLVCGYRNLTHITPVVVPSYHQREAWDLMNYVSLRLNQLSSVEVLRKMLVTFNHRAMQVSSQQRALTKKLCEGLFELKVSTVERLIHRHFVRGNHIELSVKESNFMNDGEIYLFGSVLDNILQSLVEVNSFNELSIHGIEKGVSFQWPAQL